MQRFKATLDTNAKMVTVTVCVVIIIPFIYIWEYFMASKDYKMLIAPIVVILAICLAALYKPNAYTLDNTGLEIQRAIGKKKFLLADIISVAPAVKEELGTGIRTFGSGGAFGYLGRFYYSKAKTITMFVTDRSKMILITLANDKKIMVSPNEPDLFIAAFKTLKK